MDRSKVDRRLEKGGQTKSKILFAALELMGTEGWQGLSASRLARQASVSKSTIFHHFKTMDEIPLLAVQHFLNVSMQETQTGTYTDLYTYILDLGHEILRSTEIYQKQFLSFLVLYQKALLDEEIRTSLQDIVESTLGSIRQNILQLCPRALSQEELEEVSFILATAVDGLGFHIPLARSKEPLFRAWSRLARLLTEQLISPEHPSKHATQEPLL